MSFAKAKIQRFNDIRDCSPSPAKYYVSKLDKVKYGVIPQSERFVNKLNSPTNSDAGASVHSTPCFQTPTVPKKKKFLGFSTSKSKPNDREELKERIVECRNKDAYIQDLSEQIDEMQMKISDTEKAKEKLEEDLNKFYNDLDNIREENSTRVDELQKSIEELKCREEGHLKKIVHLEESQGKILQEHQKHLANKEWEITLREELINEKYSQEIASIKKQHQNELEALKDEKDNEVGYCIISCDLKIEEMEKKLLDEIEFLNNLHQNEIKKIEDLKRKEFEEYKVKCQAELRTQHAAEIELLNKTHEDQIKKLETSKNEELNRWKTLYNETRAELKLLEENSKEIHLLNEIQMKEKIAEIEETWKLELKKQEKEAEAILKECQEISEYNIIQCEIEKNQYKNRLGERESAYESLKVEYDEIVDKYKNLDIKFGELQNELTSTVVALNVLKTERRAYEVSLNTSQETIEVLKKRLINSDRDVEQLKAEMGDYEERFIDYENKLRDLTNQIREAQMINEEMEMRYESSTEMMKDQVKFVEKALLDEVAKFETTVKQQVNQSVIDKHLFNEVVEQLYQQQQGTTMAQKLINESNLLIEQFECDNNKLESQNVDLRQQLGELKNKLAEEMEEAAEIRKKYIEKSGKYDELSQQFEQLLQELDRVKQQKLTLQDKVQELEALIAPFQQELEAYDIELKMMKEEKKNIANEAKDVTMKYADILGHQNHKQKIKHVKDLQLKASELFQQNVDLESNNYKLMKTVEKLKKELEDLKKKKMKPYTDDKENLPSPVRSFNRVESPGPLRQKN